MWLPSVLGPSSWQDGDGIVKEDKEIFDIIKRY